jgi:two-component system LytT family sensor kinase
MADAATNQPMIRRLAPLWFALLLWSGLLILFTVTAAIANSESWTESLRHSLAFWCLWLVFFPTIVWLSLRFPLQRPKLFRQAALHLSACLLVVVLSQIAFRTCLPFLPPPPDHPHPDHPDHPPSRTRSIDMRVVPDILMYLVTMCACVAYAHHQKSQERERRAIELEASLAQAKLQALRMQINPHFLFNTLNAISTLVHIAPQTADEMITDLSELFRATLESPEQHEISLSRELELLQRYLAIEQRRFGERLMVKQVIAPEILSSQVPMLILQPIVENAIRHGIEPQAGVGTITIRATRDSGHIKLSVSDNGRKPFNAAKVEANQGIGLANTRARLQQLYGADQSLIVGGGELGGWTTEIKIPFNPAPVAKAAA